MSRSRCIAAEQATDPVGLLCRTLGGSRASLLCLASCYAWRDRGPLAHERTDAHLLHHISRIHRGSRGTDGAPASTPNCATRTGCGWVASASPGGCEPPGWSAATGAAAAG